MSSFLLALRTEVFVAARSNSARLIVLAPALVVLAQYGLAKINQLGAQARDGLAGNSFEAIAAENAYGYYVDGLATGLTMLSLMLVAYGAWSFAYDRDTGVIRHLVIRRFSRRNVVLAKLAILHVMAAAAVLCLLLVARVAAGLFWEYGAVIEDGFELISIEEIEYEIGLGLQLALITLPAILCLGLLVSVVSQSTTAAVTTGLGITLALDIFKSALGSWSYYLYATFQPSLIDQSYLQDVSRIVRGYSDVLIQEQVQQLNYWVPLPQALLLATVALVLVQGRKL